MPTRQVLVRGWYYFMLLPGRYSYESGVASSHTRLVCSLISGPVPVSIPGFQPGICPTLVHTCTPCESCYVANKHDMDRIMPAQIACIKKDCIAICTRSFQVCVNYPCKIPLRTEPVALYFWVMLSQFCSKSDHVLATFGDIWYKQPTHVQACWAIPSSCIYTD